MNHKKIIPFINAENEYPANVIQLANRYSCEGADELFLYNYTGDEASREEFLSTVREIEKHLRLESMYHGLRMPKRHSIPEQVLL